LVLNQKHNVKKTRNTKFSSEATNSKMERLS
jgi:hypothetical protein